MSFRYMLRRAIDLSRAEEIIKETLEFCRQAQIHEVMWFIDCEESNHGITPLWVIEAYIPALEKAREALEADGRVFSINPWMTLLHGDRGRQTHRYYPDMGLMVGHDGTQCQACTCPADEVWRDYLCEAYRLYASTQPAVLWVEDDFRHFGHQPVEYGCFCEAHLQAFGERVGEPVTREALVQAVLAPGKPHPWRAVWLDLQGEEMIEVAQMLEQAVHEVSPRTRLGLMTSHPEWHAVEGRRWHRLLQALAGPYEPVCRPHYAAYQEGNAAGMLGNFSIALETIYHLPPGTRSCPELENHPHGRSSKSVRATRLHLILGSMVSTGEMTLNILDMLPNALVDEGYGAMLAATKPFLGEITEARDGATERGVRLMSNERASYYVHTSGGCDLTELLPGGSGWAWPLSAVGIPITYESAGAVIALTGQTIRAFSAADIQQILSGGVLIDLSALEVLTDMGWGEMLGVVDFEAVSQIDSGYAVERIVDSQFALAGSEFLSLNGASVRGRMGKINPHPGAKIITEFVHYDENTRSLPGAILFENTLGGRVAIQPLDLSEGVGTSFFKASRPHQLATIVQWLGRGALALRVQGGPYLLARRWDKPGRTTVAVINGSIDPVDHLHLALSPPDGGVASMQACTAVHGWQPIPPEHWESREGQVRIEIPGSLSGWDSLLVALLA